VGFCAVYRHFSGFEFFLLPGIVHDRPHAGNASRWWSRRVGMDAIAEDLVRWHLKVAAIIELHLD
jgi:hypothetical protein